jgi:hypothetical protein
MTHKSGPSTSSNTSRYTRHSHSTSLVKFALSTRQRYNNVTLRSPIHDVAPHVVIKFWVARVQSTQFINPGDFSKFRTALRRDDGLNDKQATRLGRGIRHRKFGNLPAMAMVRGLKRAGLMDHANLSFLNQYSKASVRIAGALRHASCRVACPP